MARYYSYGRGRYGRRYYRRGYRRYGGTSLRRYRSVQMNDNETKVMTFTSVLDGQYSFTGNGYQRYSPSELLAGRANPNGFVNPNSGRAFFAGMMFDRLRFRSASVTIRPKVMPSSSATNYVVYAAWDRYGVMDSTGEGATAPYSIRTDPSAKQVVWTPGGSGTPLRTWIYSTTRDRYQYFTIYHNNSLVSWAITVPGQSTSDSTPSFYPTLLLGFEAVTTTSTVIQYTILVRMTVEFQGGYSNTSLNYTPSTAAAAASAQALTPDEIPNAQVTEL